MLFYKLKTPKDVDGVLIRELPVNELEVDQVIALADMNRDDIRGLRKFLADAVGVDEKIIGRLTMSDFQGLVAMATGPLPEAPGTTPSP